MRADQRAALAAIHAAFADPITYDGAGLDAGEITAVFSEMEAGQFMGPGKTAKRVVFEVQFEDLPGAPAKGDTIVHETGSWTVIDIDPRRDVQAYWLSVEEADA